MKLYLKERPRTLALVANDHALLFVCPPPLELSSREKHKLAKTFARPQPRCLVQFLPVSAVPMSEYHDITTARSENGKLSAFLGLLPLKNHIFLGFVAQKTQVGTLYPKQAINMITEVVFYCLDSSQWDRHEFISSAGDASVDPTQFPCQAVTRLLSSGSFFYSPLFDLTLNLQERGMDGAFKMVADGNDYFKRFMWNSFMVEQLVSYRLRLLTLERAIFDTSGFLTIVTRGFAQLAAVTNVGAAPGCLTVISKQSCLKQGALFGPHGMDETGCTANFTETEVVYQAPGICFSYVVVQGDYPVIYTIDTHTKMMGSASVGFPRPQEVMQNAFNSHLDILQSQYGEIHILNVSGTSKKSVQQELSARYRHSVKEYQKATPLRLSYTDMELLRRWISKVALSYLEKRITAQLDLSLVDFGAVFYDATRELYVGKQLGVFRINCHDEVKALLVAQVITKTVLELALRDLDIAVTFKTDNTALWTVFESVWNRRESVLALVSGSYLVPSGESDRPDPDVRKRFVGSMAKKYLLNPVTDHSSKTRHYLVVEKLLGRLPNQKGVSLHDPIHDYVTSEMAKRESTFTSRKEIGIFVGSFNVNAAKPDADLSQWLFPDGSGFASDTIDTAADVFALGFQEIVELKPGKMLNTDATHRNFWKRKIQSTLDDRFANKPQDGRKYVLLWDGQLGGILLLLFVKASRIDQITNVEGRVRKTGFGGISANKGGVGVSFKFSGTDFCFVSSHLAAGQNNVEERHVNYKSLARGIKFSRNKRIKDHDVVMWFGDFNYRILLPLEEVKSMIQAERWAELFEHDQLGLQMTAGESFPFFNEAEILFAPTYKFDKNTNVYDTSEKARVPAWCDRIVTRTLHGNQARQLTYNSAPRIICSDHKPIYGEFLTQVKIIDSAIKQELGRRLYEQRRLEVETTPLDALYFHKYLNDLTALPAKGLPPPSSDIRKWWLTGGMLAKVSLMEGLTEGWVVNPALSVNPFEDRDTPVFVPKRHHAETNFETKPETNPETYPQTIPQTIPQTNPETKPEIKPETVPRTNPEMYLDHHPEGEAEIRAVVPKDAEARIPVDDRYPAPL